MSEVNDPVFIQLVPTTHTEFVKYRLDLEQRLRNHFSDTSFVWHSLKISEQYTLVENAVQFFLDEMIKNFNEAKDEHNGNHKAVEAALANEKFNGKT